MSKQPLSIYIFTLLLALGVTITTVASPRTAQAETPTHSAQYRVTFDATWSNSTHPFVGFPSSDHWSPMAGMTHNDAISVWQPGAMASAGVERVAESGSTSTLQGEYTTARNADNADAWIRASFSPYSGVASASQDITVSSDHPLLSVISMIAPSPDWFAGVHDLSLLDASGGWEQSLMVTLYPYDAGTENGSGYSGSNPPTVPQEIIESLRNVSPFSDAPVGTLTVTLLSPTAVSVNAAQANSAAPSLGFIAVLMLGLLTLLIVRSRVDTQPARV